MKSKTQIRTKGPIKIQAALVALLAVMALVLLSGCASVPAQGNSDPLQYNANPAIRPLVPVTPGGIKSGGHGYAYTVPHRPDHYLLWAKLSLRSPS